MRDKVTPEVALFVLKRDGGCMAPRLGGSFLDCAGRDRIEHVQLGYGRAGRRAPSCPCALLTLCEGHTEAGMRAGYVWATAHVNREHCRYYLAGFGYGPHHANHVAEILTGAVAA